MNITIQVAIRYGLTRRPIDEGGFIFEQVEMLCDVPVKRCVWDYYIKKRAFVVHAEACSVRRLDFCILHAEGIEYKMEALSCHPCSGFRSGRRF
jgi:hypothetical protein